MSAGLEFQIALVAISAYLNNRNKRYDKISEEIKKNIEDIKGDIKKLNETSSSIGRYRETSKSRIKEYITYFYEINRKDLMEKYEDILDKLDKAEELLEIREISKDAIDKFQDFKEKYENMINDMEEKRIYQEYLTIKLKQMGQEVYIDETGSLIASSGDDNIVVEIEKDKILLDVPGKAKRCITSIMEFEKLTQSELKKTSIYWHTSEKEKKIKSKIEKAKSNFNINSLYNKNLLKNEKMK